MTRIDHDGAHLVPTCSGAFKQQLLEFIDSYTAKQQAASADHNCRTESRHQPE